MNYIINWYVFYITIEDIKGQPHLWAGYTAIVYKMRILGNKIQ